MHSPTQLAAAVEDAGHLLSRVHLLEHECAAAESVDDLVAAVAQCAAGAGAVLYLLRGSVLEQVGARGLDEADESRRLRLPLDADVPLAVAAREQVPVWMGTPARRLDGYPVLASEPKNSVATASLPLPVEGRVVGALGLMFHHGHEFTLLERLFLLTLADQVAAALVRLAKRPLSGIAPWAFANDPVRGGLVDLLGEGVVTATAGVDRLAGLAARFCDAPMAHVSLLSNQQIVVGLHGGEPGAVRMPSSLEGSLCAVTVRSEAPLLIVDATSDERVSSLPAVVDGEIRSYLGVPLFHAGIPIGALCVYGPQPRQWTTGQVEVVQDLSHAVMCELESRAAAAHGVSSGRWSAELRRYDTALAGAINATQTMTALVEAAQRLRPLRYVAAVTWDESEVVRAVSASGSGRGHRWPVGSGGAARLAAHLRGRSALVLAGPAAILEYFPGDLDIVLELQIRSVLAVPIIQHDQVIGALIGGLDRPDLLDTVLERQLCELAAATAGALQRIDSYRSQVEAGARAAFLADMSLELEATLEVEETLQRVARMAVPAFADSCLVHLHEHGSSRLVAVAHLDGSKERTLRAHAATCPTVAEKIREVLAGAGTAMLGPGCLCGLSNGDDVSWRYTGGVVTVLRARGRVLGTIWFAQDRRDDRAGMDTRFIEDLALRAALALDNALLYRQRVDAVMSLQRRLLPPTLPKPAGFDLAACYETADVSLDVGGDFYDAIRQPDGLLSLVIGDVCGRGADAASMTGLARHTLRTVLEDGAGPAQALARLNRAVLADGDDGRFCTTLIIAVEESGDGAWATIASGGHPLPFVIGHDGEVRTLGTPGYLLGVVEEVSHPEVRYALRPGDTLFLFTDGVTEAKGMGGMFEDRLVDELRQCGGLTAGEVVRRIRRAVLDYRSSGVDDMAILALRVRGEPLLHLLLPAVPESAGRARHAIAQMCRAGTLVIDEDSGYDLTLAVSELVAAAVGGGDAPLELSIHRVGRTLRAEVSGGQPAAPAPDGYADAARGALIVSGVADRVGTWHDETTAAWVEVDLDRK